MLSRLILVLILSTAVTAVFFYVPARAKEALAEPVAEAIEEPVAEALEEWAKEAPQEAVEELAEEPDPAQELQALFDPAEGSSDLRGIKEKIQDVLLENARLTDEAQALKQESLQLEEKLQQARARTQVPAPAPQPAPEQKAPAKPRPGQPQTLQELRLYDLQYHKKQLELELKINELGSRGREQALERQLEGLRKELENNAAEEQRLAAQKDEWAKQNRTLLLEMGSLEQENILLEGQVRLPLLPQTSAGAGQNNDPAWENIRRKEAEKARLRQRITEMEQEKDHSSADPKLSAYDKEFRKSVEKMEQENRQLKDQILSLREKVQKRSQ